MNPHEIVLVEDDPNVSRLLALHLGRAGYRVRVAGSIEAAKRTLQDQPWDLLLLDRALPDGDGLELCSELRGARPDAYMMILTGSGSDRDKVLGFRSGADDYVTKPFNIEELLGRVRAGLRIVDLQKALRESNRLLHEMSLTDELTRLHNRRAVEQELAARFAAAQRYERPFSIVTIDVDHFKTINDTFGHQRGDAVLRGVGAILRQATRATDFAGRVGGEEFCVLLPESGLFEAIQFAEKIRALVASSPLEGHAVTVSIGVATLPHSLFSSPEELVYAADQALYRAKEKGRNRVESEKRRERFAKMHRVASPSGIRAQGIGLRAQGRAFPSS